MAQRVSPYYVVRSIGIWRWLRNYKLDILLVFVLAFALTVYWQFSKTIGDPDGFYHAKIALFLSEGRLLTTMPWMQFSTLRDSFTDHHFLYHAALVPFVMRGNPLLGAKLATALFGAGFIAVFYWLLRRFRVHTPALYTLLLVGCPALMFRLGLVKANSLSLIVLLLILFALFERRWFLLIFLNMIYVWLYSGWVLSLFIALVFVGVEFIIERRETLHRSWFQKLMRRVPRLDTVTKWHMLAATAFGLAFGLIVNPYWPGNVSFYWQQVWQIAIVNQGSIVNVGGEWSPLATKEIFAFYWFILVVYGIAFVQVLLQPSKIKGRTWVTLVVSAVSIVFTLKSRRYIELSAPLAVIFSALALADAFPRGVIRHLWHSWKGEAQWMRNMFTSMIVGLIIILVLPNVGIWAQVVQVRAQLNNAIPFDRYERVSRWIARNTPPHSTIVHSDWDDWPMLFYHNDRNYYIIGLDPTFMYNDDALLYHEWASLTARGEAENPALFISQRLQSEYVIIEKDHTAMHDTIGSNIYFRLVYEDDEVWVHRFIARDREL